MRKRTLELSRRKQSLAGRSRRPPPTGHRRRTAARQSGSVPVAPPPPPSGKAGAASSSSRAPRRAVRSLVQGRAATRGESREPRRASRPCRSRAPRPRAPVPTPARAPAAGAHGRSRAGFSANGRAACRLRAGPARNGRGAPGAPGRGRPRQPPCAWLLCAPSAPRWPTRRPVLSPARPSCAGHQVGLRQRRPRGSALSVRELVRRAPPARASAIRLPSAPARRPRCCRRGGPPRVLGESFRAARSRLGSSPDGLVCRAEVWGWGEVSSRVFPFMDRAVESSLRICPRALGPKESFLFYFLIIPSSSFWEKCFLTCAQKSHGPRVLRGRCAGGGRARHEAGSLRSGPGASP